MWEAKSNASDLLNFLAHPLLEELPLALAPTTTKESESPRTFVSGDPGSRVKILSASTSASISLRFICCLWRKGPAENSAQEVPGPNQADGKDGHL